MRKLPLILFLFASVAYSQLDPYTNFGSSILYSTMNSSTTTLKFRGGDRTKFPNPGADGAFNVIVYNSTDYAHYALDPYVEIMRVTARGNVAAYDSFIVTRAQEGTSAVAHNKTGKTYTVFLTLTKRFVDSVAANLGGGGGSGWSLTGNSGTDDYDDFVGTVDSQTVTVRSYDWNGGTLELNPNGNAAIYSNISPYSGISITPTDIYFSGILHGIDVPIDSGNFQKYPDTLTWDATKKYVNDSDAVRQRNADTLSWDATKTDVSALGVSDLTAGKIVTFNGTKLISTTKDTANTLEYVCLIGVLDNQAPYRQIILRNDLSDTLTWTRSAEGIYFATLASPYNSYYGVATLTPSAVGTSYEVKRGVCNNLNPGDTGILIYTEKADGTKRDLYDIFSGSQVTPDEMAKFHLILYPQP